MSHYAIVVLLACLSASLVSYQEPTPLPRFEDFPVKEIYKGKPAKLHWPEWPSYEFFKTSITELVESGANFAGQYAIREWSCGTNCRWIVMIDLKTGKFLQPGGYGSLSLERESIQSKSGLVTPLIFRPNSRLLVASGCFDVESEKKPVECGMKYFVLEKQQFRQVHYVPRPTPTYFK